jgi:hypothetical protein
MCLLVLSGVAADLPANFAEALGESADSLRATLARSAITLSDV